MLAKVINEALVAMLSYARAMCVLEHGWGFHILRPSRSVDAVERALQALLPPGAACPMQSYRPTRNVVAYDSLHMLWQHCIVYTIGAGGCSGRHSAGLKEP